MDTTVRSGSLTVRVDVGSDGGFEDELLHYREDTDRRWDGVLTLRRFVLDTQESERGFLNSLHGSYLLQRVGGRVRSFSDEGLSNLTTYFVGVALPQNPVKLELVQLFLSLLIPRGGLVLHAASTSLASRAVAFVGPCGAGKSTAARLLGGHLLSDDLVTVETVREGAIAHSTTFGGVSHGPASLPLAAIVFPRRGTGLELLRLSPLGAALRFKAGNWGFLCHVVPPLMEPLLDTILKLFRSVPAWEMQFSLDTPPDAIRSMMLSRLPSS